MKVSLLHLAPFPGEVDRNRRLVETAILTAAQSGARWIVTPELSVCGYGFGEIIGTDWVLPQPDEWMQRMCRLAAVLDVALFLSHPERDLSTGRLYNSLFAISRHGTIAGTHRKINVLPGSESWSSPGLTAEPVSIDGMAVGLVICADVCTGAITQCLRDKGAQILVSAASWGPGPYEPNGEWERCTVQTELPLFVCNRTGEDVRLSFSGATSTVVQNGQRLLTFQSDTPAIVSFDWDLQSQRLKSTRWQLRPL